MPKKPRAFRPFVNEFLESRTVPSAFGGFNLGGDFGDGLSASSAGRGGSNSSSSSTSGSDDFGMGMGMGMRMGPGPGMRDGDGGFGGFGGGGVQTAVTSDNQTIRDAIRTFEESYANDVKTILYGSGTPADNRSAFDTQVAADLETLNASIDSAIANITGSANTTLASTIEADLLGSDSTSLKSELAAITTPTSTDTWGGRIFSWEANADIVQASRTIGKLVSTATVPAGTVSQDTVDTLKTAIDTAYQSFTQGYINASQTTATNPAKDRTAFDTAVSGLISTLSSNISTALTAANLPSSVSTSLATTITADLTGTPAAGKSLQASLAALGSPSSTTGFAGWYFLGRSRGVTFNSERTVVNDILTAINTYNTSLTE